MTVEQLRSQIGVSGFDFKFKIDKVMRVYNGTGQYGPWQLQNCVVSDGTGKIQVNLKNNVAIPEGAVGQYLHVRCKEVNGELKGTTVEAESFETDNGEHKTVTKIVVTKVALVTVEPAQNAGPSDGPTHHPAPNAPAPPQASNEAITGAILGACDLLSTQAVSDALQRAQGYGWTSEDVRAVAITLFLQANRR